MAYLAQIMAGSGGVVTRAELEAFTYDGAPLKLIDQSRGIRNPRELTATLSILSQPKGPYDDVETEDRAPDPAATAPAGVPRPGAAGLRAGLRDLPPQARRPA